MEIGLCSFGDLTPQQKGQAAVAAKRLEEMIAAAKLADQAGFAVFAVGEHHRLDFAVSATPVVLAAMAQHTRNIRLASAVTILSTSDPVKVYEDFATVDLLSRGRAEIIAGRGIFLESFPLYGFKEEDSDALFAEKLDLLLKIDAAERVTWQGRFRTPLDDAAVAPRPLQQPLPVWVGTGGTPESVARAGALGLPMALANISIPPAKLAPLAALYRTRAREVGRDPARLKISITSHLHIARNSQDARETFYPYYAGYFHSHTPRQYKAREVTREEYARLASPEGALFVGSPQEIVDKILYERELFRHDRFMAQIDLGGLPFAKVASVIELLATDVMPKVRKAN